jgi:Uma2 family endonuclease
MGTGEHTSFRRFTAEETMRMVEVGILGEDERLELLDGVLVEMTPPGPEHASTTVTLGDRLRAVYAGRAHVREEKPIVSGTYSLPEPDIAVVRGGASSFTHRHPTGAEAILVVEIAWSTQRENRRKASVYAAGGVEVYWLLDLVARRLELRTTPADGTYRVTRTLAEDDVVELPESTERWIVRELLA